MRKDLWDSGTTEELGTYFQFDDMGRISEITKPGYSDYQAEAFYYDGKSFLLYKTETVNGWESGSVTVTEEIEYTKFDEQSNWTERKVKQTRTETEWTGDMGFEGEDKVTQKETTFTETRTLSYFTNQEMAKTTYWVELDANGNAIQQPGIKEDKGVSTFLVIVLCIVALISLFFLWKYQFCKNMLESVTGYSFMPERVWIHAATSVLSIAAFAFFAFRQDLATEYQTLLIWSIVGLCLLTGLIVFLANRKDTKLGTIKALYHMVAFICMIIAGIAIIVISIWAIMIAIIVLILSVVFKSMFRTEKYKVKYTYLDDKDIAFNSYSCKLDNSFGKCEAIYSGRCPHGKL
ncbi:MAG: hypothetical protein LUE98_18175 [Tannerellaceae bacterium]|nr:hypothetical protein [Tannerellaceae bacterium]